MENAGKSLDILLAEKNETVLQSPEWFQQLEEAVSHLIQQDFPRLVQILYRIDVGEAALKKALSDNPATDAAKIIAEKIVKRMLQKLETRKLWQQREDIPDDEKW